jgi:ATP-dependent Lhr-like helicase
LLDRYGIVTREAAHAEGIAGGFAAVYDVLKALEEQGRVRRGYFVKAHGGAQFALPGADESLRALRDDSGSDVARVLAATDPGNAWGALLEWPSSAAEERPRRAAGARVVLWQGRLLGWLGPGAHPLLTFFDPDGAGRSEAAAAMARALAGLVDGERRRALLISSIDGVPAAQSSLAPVFAIAGFAITMRGLLKRAPFARGEMRPQAPQ